MRETARSSHDVVIAGAGPAGVALAAALAERGVDVLVVAPEGPRAWRNNYSLWGDEAERVGVTEALAARWPAARVRIAGTTSHQLAREYAIVDNERLADLLLARARPAFRAGAVDAVAHEADGTRVRLADGGELTSRLFVDATGAGHFVSRARARRVYAQVAYGQWLEDARGDALDPSTVLLMDFDQAPATRPTFLYALPFARDRIFVEETSLVASPPLSMDDARARLSARLSRMGVSGRVVAEERCYIPMGAPIPHLNQRTLAFGAAASLTHPATGYQLAASLTLAPRVATSIAAGLAARTPAAELSREIWRLIWPRARRDARALHRFGMDVVASLGADDLRSFFDAFFNATGDRWPDLMSADAPPEAVAHVMDATFFHLSRPLRARASRVLLLRHPTLIGKLASAVVARSWSPRRALPEPRLPSAR
jgi:lycopene cyclase-like protein